MRNVQAGRFAVTPPDGTVVFLIGMRINKLGKVRRWFPVFTAMPRMLKELSEQRELGLVNYRLFFSGRVLLVVEYWESVEKLNAYARAKDHDHLPAWRAFNRSVGTNGDVGIFHETIVVGSGNFEAIYGNVPADLLGAALGTVDVSTVGQSAAHRMKPTAADDPAVPVPS